MKLKPDATKPVATRIKNIWRLGGDVDVEDRRFGPKWAHFWFVGWDCVSLGVSLCFGAPNLEIHVPFGFFKIGWPSKSVKVPIRIPVRASNLGGPDWPAKTT